MGTVPFSSPSRVFPIQTIQKAPKPTVFNKTRTRLLNCYRHGNLESRTSRSYKNAIGSPLSSARRARLFISTSQLLPSLPMIGGGSILVKTCLSNNMIKMDIMAELAITAATSDELLYHSLTKVSIVPVIALAATCGRLAATTSGYLRNTNTGTTEATIPIIPPIAQYHVGSAGLSEHRVSRVSNVYGCITITVSYPASLHIRA
jgi:hypothetical protein